MKPGSAWAGLGDLTAKTQGALRAFSVLSLAFCVALGFNNWANLQIIQACSALSDEQLDAEPQSATKGSIRHTLMHLVASQQGYLSLLTLPVEARLDVPPAFAELQESARRSGEGLLSLPLLKLCILCVLRGSPVRQKYL